MKIRGHLRDRALPLLAAAAALAVAVAPARAAPLDDPFVGGLSFSGPTSGSLAAIYWNPAALGLVRGFQLMVAGTARVSSTTARLPGGSATAHDITQPLQWPAGPGAFIALSSDLGGDRFTLGFATYEPFVEQNHYPTSPAGDEPTRYHRLGADLRNLALVPALAIRFGTDFRIGVAPGFLFSTGRLTFVEPGPAVGGVPAGIEGDARYDLDSGQSIGKSRFSVTLGGGIYFRRRNFEFGLAYSSRPLGTDVDGVEVGGDQSVVTRPARDGGGLVTCPSGQANRCVFADIAYRLPDIWIGGVTWHPRPGLEVTAMTRWIWLHLQDEIDIRLTSPALQAAGLPDHIVLHRGFKDVWDTRVRVAYWIKERLRVGAALRVETSAVGAADVNPAAVDGLKFEPIVLAELRVSKHFSVSAGYGFTYMPGVTVTASSFDPNAAAACSAAGNDLANPACVARLQGRARPSADGSYARTVHDFGAAMTARF
jgi:long-subunit fatty acid transport protein